MRDDMKDKKELIPPAAEPCPANFRHQNGPMEPAVLRRQLPDDTWCNPLTLENYPCGFLAPSRYGKDKASASDFNGPIRDFRELSDPEVLYDNGTWYIFPSCGDAYSSTDLVHWKYCKILFTNGEHLGYAPTVVKCRNRYLLSSSLLFSDRAEIFEADSPLGPYRSLGTPTDGAGHPLAPEWLDPMLFADDDGRLYAYWHFGGEGKGIFGIELDADDPARGIGQPVKLMDFDPSNRFERYGEFNEHPRMAWIEGASMFKHNGEYYLQYAGCGTQFHHYALGVCRGKSPLGPFLERQRTPVALQPYGRVTGTGHGCWVRGPENSVWQFYTVLVRRIYKYERRIGMDKVEFAPDGSAHVTITSTPQSVFSGDLGQLPLSVNKAACASSSSDCCFPGFAVDDCTHTWWMPGKDDKEPFLEVDLRQEFIVTSFQVCWAEEGLDYRAGVLPEAVKYAVLFFDEEHKPCGQADLAGNDRDLLADFHVISPVCARFVRLVIHPTISSKLRLGVNNFTVFGFPDETKA